MLAFAQPQIVAGIIALPWAKPASGRTRAIRLRGGTAQETRSSSREALVPVMEAADFRQRHDLAHAGRVDRSRLRRVLAERQMGSRPVVVREVRLQDAVEVLLTEDDDVSEALSPYRSHKPFGVGIRVSLRLHVMGTARLLPFG